MVEVKGYSAHDGAGDDAGAAGRHEVGIITKRISETVALRARDLKLEFVYQGEAFKMRPVREIMEKEGVTLDEIAYVGDDVIDLPVMRKCGFAVAMANARATSEGRGALCNAATRAAKARRAMRSNSFSKRRAC